MRKQSTFLALLCALLICVLAFAACDTEDGVGSGVTEDVGSPTGVTGTEDESSPEDESKPSEGESVSTEGESEPVDGENDPDHVCEGKEWITLTEPTCERAGEKVLVCSCESILERKLIRALGHDTKAYAAKAPTCEEIGWDAYEVCQRTGCSYTTYRELGELGHDEEQHAAKEPTCEASGWGAYVTCKREGCRYTTYVEEQALAHEVTGGRCYNCSYIADYDGFLFISNGDGTCEAQLAFSYSDVYDVPSYVGIPYASPAGDTVVTFALQGYTVGFDLIRGLRLPAGVQRIYGVENCVNLDLIIVDSANTSYRMMGDCLVELASGTLIKGLSDAVIPTDGSVTSIGYSAFKGCTGLTSIHVPKSVTYVSGDAFLDCPNVTEITVDPENTVYRAAGNCLIEKESGSLVLGCKNSVIPDDGSVTGIGQDAFYGCTGLISIAIPASVEDIGWDAFDGCTALASVTFGENSRLTSIGSYAFYGCKKLEVFTIPASVREIGASAFYECERLLQTEDGVSYVDTWVVDVASGTGAVTLRAGTRGIVARALDWTGSVDSIEIPASVAHIATDAFSDCPSPSCIAIDPANTSYRMTGDCLVELASGTLIKGFSSSVIPTDGSVTKIGEDAFSDCTWLTSIAIPASVESIGSRAFEDCTKLASVTFGENSRLTIISSWAFHGCTELTGIAIPASVDRIDNGAFEGCTNLASVTFGENSRLTIISMWAFRGCTELRGIVLPESLVYLYTTTFEGCTGLLQTEDGVSYVDQWVVGFDGSTTEVTLRAGTVGIASGVFAGCTELEKVTLPESLVTVASRAFYGCTGLLQTEDGVSYVGKWAVGCDTTVTEVTLRADTVGIAGSAFANCTSLASVALPDSVKYLGAGAFVRCTSLREVTMSRALLWISYAAFSGCTALESIAVPVSVEHVGAWAFHDCTALGTVHFAQTEGWVMLLGGDRIELSATEVANGALAATQLKTYYEYIWRRAESC